MSDELWKAYVHGMAAALGDGGVYLPGLLLRSGGSLGLSHSETMLMLHIMLFSEAEMNDFPTPEELAERMGTDLRAVVTWLSRLTKEGFLSIDDYVDSATGVQAERYNWSGWLKKASEWEAARRRESKRPTGVKPARKLKPASDLFSVFEQEFGRLLSPMECETISAWLDQDKYSEEIILFALKEAVFAGKLSLRYIDRILIEWSRNRITNADEARAHASKYYGGKG